MKAKLLVTIGLLLSPISAVAQIPNCLNCTLGIYDEPAMLNNFGDITPFVEKSIYLGIKLATPETNVIGIELSIAGLQAGSNLLVIGVESITTPAANIILGSPPAPPDTSATSTQTGGMNVSWPNCITGSQALLRIGLLALAPVTNHRLLVMHRFPPSNPNYGKAHPIIIRCNPPTFTAVRVTGGDYFLGGVVGVEGQTWGGLKGLYR